MGCDVAGEGECLEKSAHPFRVSGSWSRVDLAVSFAVEIGGYEHAGTWPADR